MSAPSMFGRDLIEQVRADGRGGPRNVPVIVEKCIEAVEELGMFHMIATKSRYLMKHDICQQWTMKAYTEKLADRVSHEQSLNSSSAETTTRSIYGIRTNSTIFAVSHLC